MNVLLVGSGGREAAIAQKLVDSPRLTRLFVAPGNGGTSFLPKTENVAIAAHQLDELVTFAQAQDIALTVVGPEVPLVDGLADRLQAVGRRVFGPTQAAARIEGSKAFAKEFMGRHGIPTARSGTFTDFDEAMRYLRQLDAVPVIKASGLAAGKGVILPSHMEAAAQVVHSMLVERRFGAAGATIVIEERLSGPEVSVLAFTDGQTVRVMPPAQDHKRLRDGDEGPNTGGMGAFTPSPLVDADLLAEIERTILQPTIAGMAAEGMPYVGVLFAGLMLTPRGPRVLEFNARFGDPETEVILPLLESDLLEILLACGDGRLADVPVRWGTAAAVAVVMASDGYPDDYTTGYPITGIADAEALGCRVYQAGTKLKDKLLLTAGGRVLAVTATGRSISQASHRAYAGVAKIQFIGAFYRRDIGRPLPPQRVKRRRGEAAASRPKSQTQGTRRKATSRKSA
jgi:phosphoribosylamine--glycine ligase